MILPRLKSSIPAVKSSLESMSKKALYSWLYNLRIRTKKCTKPFTENINGIFPCKRKQCVPGLALGGPGNNKAKVLGNCDVNIERLGSGVALSSLHVM